MIASNAHFFWDLRTIPMDSIQEIMETFESYCRQREDELRPTYRDFSIRTIENHPIVPHLDTKEDAAIVDLVKRISGNGKLNTVAYAAEAGHFANAGFQTAICGPGSIIQAHRADEYISKDQLTKGTEMLRRLIQELSSKAFA